MTTTPPSVDARAVLPIMERHVGTAVTQAAAWEAIANEYLARAEQAEMRAADAEHQLAELRAATTSDTGEPPA